MLYIPTVTTHNEKYPIQLFSPSLNCRRDLFGAQYTLIDCHTFYLRKFGKNANLAKKHYVWYVDYVTEYQNNESLIFVQPDISWLKDCKFTSQLNSKWNQQITSKQILYTEVFDGYNMIATNVANIPIGKFAWIHLFGNQIVKTKITDTVITYDSMRKPDNFVNNEKAFERTIIAIQTLLRRL